MSENPDIIKSKFVTWEEALSLTGLEDVELWAFVIDGKLIPHSPATQDPYRIFVESIGTPFGKTHIGCLC